MLGCPAAATLLPLRGRAPAPAALLALRLMPAALPPACLALPAALPPACLVLPAAGAGCAPADAAARTCACAAEVACCATVQLAGASAAVGELLDGCWLSPDLLAAAVAAGAAMCPAAALLPVHGLLLPPCLPGYTPAGAGASARGESVTG
jgi:hypothetical protein